MLKHSRGTSAVNRLFDTAKNHDCCRFPLVGGVQSAWVLGSTRFLATSGCDRVLRGAGGRRTLTCPVERRFNRRSTAVQLRRPRLLPGARHQPRTGTDRVLGKPGDCKNVAAESAGACVRGAGRCMPGRDAESAAEHPVELLRQVCRRYRVACFVAFTHTWDQLACPDDCAATFHRGGSPCKHASGVAGLPLAGEPRARSLLRPWPALRACSTASNGAPGLQSVLTSLTHGKLR